MCNVGEPLGTRLGTTEKFYGITSYSCKAGIAHASVTVLSTPVMLINPLFMYSYTLPHSPVALLVCEDVSISKTQRAKKKFSVTLLSPLTYFFITNFLSTLFNATITFRREISQSLAISKISLMTNCFPP